MSTLAELLEQGKAVIAKTIADQAEKERQEAQERKLVEAELVAAARLAGRELLGAAFDELVQGEPEVNNYRTSVTWRMALGPGARGFGFEWERRGARLRASMRGDIPDLVLPAEPEALARFIEHRKADYEYHRQKAIELATRLITEPDWEYSEDPQTAYNNCVGEWPDAADALRPVLEAELARRAEKAQAALAKETHQADVQSRLWSPIAVWRVTYAAWTFQDGDEFPVPVGTKETAYSLAPQADGDGWWPLCHQGKKTLTLLPHLLKVEEVVLKEWGCDEAKLVCGRYPVDGATVLIPPHDAVLYMPA